MSILRTKLYRPPVPSDYVHRPRILEYLERGRDRPLILVSAPAGYGKSILISSWLDTCNRPGAWVSFDEQDSDLRRFLSYFLAAVQTIFPAAVLETLSMLKAPDLPPVSVLAHSLINDLDLIEESFILVLDDYHLINQQAANGFLRELLRHPPGCMHLVIISRKDPFLPISSLRARDMLAEVRIHDLRFTLGETAEFIKLNLATQVDERTSNLLAEKTEGWVTKGVHGEWGRNWRKSGDTFHVGGQNYLETLLNLKSGWPHATSGEYTTTMNADCDAR